jgi:ATP-dependent protease Clp ATPase subunit
MLSPCSLPIALGRATTLSQAVYAGGQVKTILAWDFHISPEDTCPKAIVT